MKSVIMGMGVLILSIIVYMCVNDVKTYQRYDYDLKFVCEELSATGTLYIDPQEYASGRMVFNQLESKKAIHEQLVSMLKTDDSLNPLANSYWRDTVLLKTYFRDDSTNTFPCLFVDPDTGYTVTLTSPAVIVTVNAGSGRFYFPFFSSAGHAVRSASHEWKPR